MTDGLDGLAAGCGIPAFISCSLISLSLGEVELAIISGEKNRAIELLAEKFDIKEIHMNIRKKIDVLKSIVEKYSLSEDEFVYIGDDVNDLESLEFSKYRITVPHAPIKLKQVENIQITDVDGGEGAFREVVECLIG